MNADEIVALGREFNWEFRPRLLGDGKPTDGLVGNLAYRYKQMVSGNAPHIDLFDASHKHRRWTGYLTFELGLAFSDGIEPKGLVDENKIAISFGTLYRAEPEKAERRSWRGRRK